MSSKHDPRVEHSPGRPRLDAPRYTPEKVEMAARYVEQFREYGDEVPSVSGLARLLSVTRKTVVTWSNDEKKPEFSDIFDRLKSEQTRHLINKGLANEFNPLITKLLLAQHGIRDKQELVGADGQQLFRDIDDTERAARIAAILDAAGVRRAGHAADVGGGVDGAAGAADGGAAE